MTRHPAELFDCERVNAYLDSYLLDQVPPPERRGMRLHIHGCPSCFEKVVARDPLQLFAPLADQTPPERTWDGFWPAIAEGIRAEETRRSRRQIWARAAAVLVAAAALAVALFVIPSVGRHPSGSPQPVLPVVAETHPAPASPSHAVEPGGPLPQTVERVRTNGSGDVQVYTMSYTQEAPAHGSASGDAGADTPPAPVAELVLIVDKGLRL